MKRLHHITPAFAFHTLCLLAPLLLQGCLSPIVLNRAVNAYDQAVTDGLSEQLLVNIARAANRDPVHFTTVSSIAATFDFRVSAGGTPPFGGTEGGFVLSPVFGSSLAENPTITIVPIEGEDFTRRLLTPFEENKLTLLLRQHYDIDLLLRLMAEEFRTTQGETREVSYRNHPATPQEYAWFRKIVVHISTIQDRNQLYVEPVALEHVWYLPQTAFSGQDLTTLGDAYDLTYDNLKEQYALRKKLRERMTITNYPPTMLTPEERMQLHQKVTSGSPNDLFVDIRPGFPGGEFPIHGHFRLRSFHAILNFLGRNMDDAPEFDVPPDPRSGVNPENPPWTLKIDRSHTKPSHASPLTRYQGEYYYIKDQTRWNREAFRLLSQLFQMTVSEIPRVGIPSITIAK